MRNLGLWKKEMIIKLKGFKSQNLRDHMSEAELIFTALAEFSTNEISGSEKAKGLTENAKEVRKVVLLQKTHEKN